MKISIRSKLIVSLLLVCTLCLTIYVAMVKVTFEKDKEASIFEYSTQTNLIMTQNLNQQIREVVDFGQNILLSFEKGQFTATGKKIFSKKKSVLFFAVRSGESIKQFETNSQLYSKKIVQDLSSTSMRFLTKLNDSGHMLVSLKLENSDDKKNQNFLFIGFDLGKTFEGLGFDTNSGGTVIVLNKETVIGQFTSDAKEKVLLLASEANIDPIKKSYTFVQKLDQDYLSSFHLTDIEGVAVFTSIPKNHAYSGLYILYKKSGQFLFLVLFIVLSITAFMSRSLTKNLKILTAASKQISKGEFDIQLKIKSRDEVETLSQSFLDMAQKIKKLLIEVKEKARMESELNTARTVQNTLFPKKGYQSEKVRIEGYYRTASECGGDWWYYFENAKGIFGIIADATGHGAGPAIVTAAAKATVSLVQDHEDLTVLKLAEYLNHSIFQTSNGEILMTAFIFLISKDGTFSYVNASHEAPLINMNNETKYMDVEVSPRLGQKIGQVFKVGEFKTSGAYDMIIFTDGITGQVNEKERDFGDKKLLKLVQKSLSEFKSLDSINNDVVNEVDKFRGHLPQYDDITIVSLKVG